MLNQIKQRIQSYRSLPFDLSDFEREAAVMLCLFNRSDDIEVVLVKRAETLSTHAGEVALPGGIMDETDADLVEAALRETHEEIDLPRHHIEVVGELSAMVSRWSVKVTPIVGLVESMPKLTPNLGEVDLIFSVPLSHFRAHNITGHTAISYQGQRFKVPEFEYDGLRIWGMTALILTDFVIQCCDSDIKLSE